MKQMDKILLQSLKTLAMVLGLLTACNAFGWLMAYLRVPMLVTHGLLAISDNRIVILLLINLMLLLLGTIMDMAPLIVITTPILLPIVTTLGMSPIHFGVMMVLNLAIGLCTPPVGAALFVGCSIGKIKIEKVSISMLPFYFVMVTVLMLITFIPQLVLFVPTYVLG